MSGNTSVPNSTRRRRVQDRRACQVCGSTDRELRPGVLVKPAVGDLIRQDIGKWDENGWVCEKDLQKYRFKYVEDLIEAEKGELTGIEREVLESIREQDIIAENPLEAADARLTLGQRMADRIADFGGSWTFIIIFFVLLVAWMLMNTYLILAHPFDPYPYIFLNLVLSCLAAIQAPIIMMSQNRQEERDRLRATQDYQVNLKAEIEVRHLHQKVDHLLTHQWEMLLDIQETQSELLDALLKNRKKGGQA